MFDRNKNKPVPATVAEPARPATPSVPATPNPVPVRSEAMIGPTIVIKGSVSGDEDLLVQGKVEGTIDLNAHVVSVGQSGKVTADINAKIVNIDGEVAGDITGNEKVVISKSGNVRGNIVAPRVTLEDGAIFKGSIDMDPGGTAVNKVSLASEKATATPAAKPAASPAGRPSVSAADNAPELDLKSG